MARRYEFSAEQFIIIITSPEIIDNCSCTGACVQIGLREFGAPKVKKIFTTSVIKKSTDPVWNECFQM